MIYYLSRRRLPHGQADVDKLEKKAHLIQQLNMCQGFSANGEDVCFVSPGTASPPWEFVSEYYGLSERFELRAARTTASNHTFQNLPIPDADDQALTYWLLYMLLSGNFEPGDIVYSRNLNPTRYLLAFRDVTSLGDDVTVWFEQHQVDRGVDGDFYDRLDGVVCISRRQQRRMLEANTIDKSKMVVAHDGVDLEAYKGLSTTEARQQLGFDPDERIIMYTGHLYPSKDVETLVQAASEFDGSCHIVGGYDEDIDRIKSILDVPETVTFTGFVSPASIPLYQAAADVLVATVAAKTGEYEFFSPLKLFEYMAASKPLVVSKKSAYEEILTHEKNALFFEPGSVEELAEAVRILLSKPDMRQRLGQQARQDVQQYGWTNRCRGILNEIEVANG